MRWATVLTVLVGTSVVLVALWGVFVWNVQRRVLFPAPVGVTEPRIEGDDFEAVWLDLDRKVGGGRVELWLLPPRGVGGRAPWIFFAHGNGELIDFWVDRFEAVRDAGIGVALVEYPSYGRSSGRPSQRSVESTMVAAYDLLIERADVDATRLIGYGRSLGCGAVCRLALRRPLAAMVLESAFSSVRPLARTAGVPGFLVRDPFDNRAVVAGFEQPILLLHGNRDDLIPIEHSRRLHAVAPDSELVELPCGHNDCPRSWDRVLDLVGRISPEGTGATTAVGRESDVNLLRSR